MAETLKVLGQSAAITGGIDYTLYTVPSNTSAIISSFVVCNRSSLASAFSMLVATGGAGTTDSQYLYYQTPIGGNDTFAATIGISLSTTDVIRVNSLTGSASLTYTLFGAEIT